jgi:hypothetical protein
LYWLVAAKERALEAYALSPEDALVNKWCALTLGVACDFAATKEKISMGKQFEVRVCVLVAPRMCASAEAHR